MRTRSLVTTVSLLVLCTALPAAARAQRPAVTVITGTLLGADGAPMQLAHVHLMRSMVPGRIARAQVTAGGRFAIATTETGAIRLLFTGVEHHSTSAWILITAPTTIALDVRLRHHAYGDGLDSVRAIGEWNGFQPESARPLVRQPDGRYTLEIRTAADTLAYQLVGLDTVGTATTGGTRADRYAYVDNSGYRSVVRSRNGRATIAFDPSALRRLTGVASVVFRDSMSPEGRRDALIRRWEARARAMQDFSRAARARGDTLRFDWRPFVTEQLVLISRERDPITRQLLLLQLLVSATMGAKFDPALGWRLAREIPPSSPWFAFPEAGSPTGLMYAFRAGLGRTEPLRAGSPPDTALNRLMRGYLDRVAAEHADSLVRGEALASAIGWSDGAVRNDYYLRFVRDYPNAPSADYVKSRFAPNRVWRAGGRVPAFRLASLDDSSVTLTPASLAGRPHLIEFWATWCGPCVAEMADLHAAHDSLAADSVEFLSVSLDEKREDVTRFRAGEWRMPWRHAIVPGGFANPLLRDLEILFVPRAILVGSDGSILAVDQGLRGRSLVPTIREALRAARSQ